MKIARRQLLKENNKMSCLSRIRVHKKSWRKTCWLQKKFIFQGKDQEFAASGIMELFRSKHIFSIHRSSQFWDKKTFTFSYLCYYLVGSTISVTLIKVSVVKDLEITFQVSINYIELSDLNVTICSRFLIVFLKELFPKNATIYLFIFFQNSRNNLEEKHPSSFCSFGLLEFLIFVTIYTFREHSCS